MKPLRPPGLAFACGSGLSLGVFERTNPFPSGYHSRFTPGLWTAGKPAVWTARGRQTARRPPPDHTLTTGASAGCRGMLRWLPPATTNEQEQREAAVKARLSDYGYLDTQFSTDWGLQSSSAAIWRALMPCNAIKRALARFPSLAIPLARPPRFPRSD